MATAKATAAKTAKPSGTKGRPKTVETFNRLPDANGIVRQVDLNPASIAKLFDVASNSARPLTVAELSFKTLIPRGTINAILEATPEGKTLVEGNLIALKRGPGFPPAWVAHAKNPKKIPIPGAGNKGEVVLWENTALPATIRETAIIKDFNGVVSLVDELAASSRRGPKFVLAKREAFIERAIDTAQKQQASFSVVEELTERQGEMRDHYGLLKSRSEQLEEELRVLRLEQEVRTLRAAAETAGA